MLSGTLQSPWQTEVPRCVRPSSGAASIPAAACDTARSGCLRRLSLDWHARAGHSVPLCTRETQFLSVSAPGCARTCLQAAACVLTGAWVCCCCRCPVCGCSAGGRGSSQWQAHAAGGAVIAAELRVPLVQEGCHLSLVSAGSATATSSATAAARHRLGHACTTLGRPHVGRACGAGPARVGAFAECPVMLCAACALAVTGCWASITFGNQPRSGLAHAPAMVCLSSRTCLHAPTSSSWLHTGWRAC